MRSFIRSSYTATSVLGSTLVYALPQNGDRMIPRQYSFDGIEAATGSLIGNNAQTTLSPTVVQAAATSNPQADVAATSTPHDTVTQLNTNTWSITTTSGSVPNPADNFSALDFSPSASSTSSAAAEHGSLAPAPTVSSSHPLSGHGVLTGVVVGGLALGLLCLTVGLWFCYRRRGPTSGASTPRYTTTVVGDEKPKSKFGQWFKSGSMPFKKSHSRIRSSMSFASPILENEPKMMESNASSVRSPLAPHLSGSTATRGDWSNNGRWSTFSTSDGSVYPQTPAGGQISGIHMETVIETDAVSDPRTPTMAPRRDIDYTDMKRSSDERLPPLNTSFGSGGSPPGSNRFSDGPPTPSTYSSGGLTYGSIGHGSSHYIRASNGITQQPILPTQFNNGSNPKFTTTQHHTAPLLSSKPRFDPTTRHMSGSSTASIDRESGETIKITNPFLDDEDGISSYGHGVLEADDRGSIRTMDSDAHGAYPSSTGCLDPKVTISPSPSPDAPLTRPRSSMISDSSSDYPYPLGHAVDSDGNVVNPFLRISEILEEVDGRMRWPSPPLLPRAESRNY